MLPNMRKFVGTLVKYVKKIAKIITLLFARLEKYVKITFLNLTI